MRTVRYVSFQGEFSGRADDTPEHLSGFPEIAGLIVSSLRQAGVEADEPENHEDWAYSVDARHKGARVWFLVAGTDEVRPWVVGVHVAPPGLLGWILGRYGKVIPAALELCEILHGALSRHPKVRCLRWYTADAWENDQDHGWTEKP